LKGESDLEQRKKLKLVLGLCLWFLIYMLFIAVLVGFSLITGHWFRLLDLGLYLGNVVAFGLSFYIMNQGRKLKMKWMVVAGVFVFLSNLWGIVKFYL
jgi:hypothetical protein